MENKKGVSMIIVLWIMAILTVLTTATALMTRSDVASTLNIIKRKGALQIAENGSDYFISMIPDNSVINSQITADDMMRLEAAGGSVAVHRVYMNDDSTRSFVLAPVPMIYNTALGNNPYGPISSGGSGTYYVYEFSSGGLMGRKEDVKSPQKIVDVAAGWWTPLSASGGAFGHTMY
jgi:hypothetical protein